MSNGKYLVSPSVSSRVSLEYKLQNGWIERLARRGWLKFSTAGKPGSCGTADVAWLWERKRALAMPRATRSSRIGTASSDGKKKKRKKLSLYIYIYIQIRASNEIYLASLLAMEHLSTTLFTLFSNEFYPFDERIQTEPSPKRSSREPIRRAFEMRSFVSLAFLVSRASRMLKMANKTEEWGNVYMVISCMGTVDGSRSWWLFDASLLPAKRSYVRWYDGTSRPFYLSLPFLAFHRNCVYVRVRVCEVGEDKIKRWIRKFVW